MEGRPGKRTCRRVSVSELPHLSATASLRRVEQGRRCVMFTPAMELTLGLLLGAAATYLVLKIWRKG